MAAGFGEPHNIELEAEKRLIKQFAEEITALIVKENCTRWYLAADKSINSQIIEKLDPPIMAKLEKNITANSSNARCGCPSREAEEFFTGKQIDSDMSGELLTLALSRERLYDPFLSWHP
jgi:hypothetical protein